MATQNENRGFSTSLSFSYLCIPCSPLDEARMYMHASVCVCVSTCLCVLVLE